MATPAVLQLPVSVPGHRKRSAAAPRLASLRDEITVLLADGSGCLEDALAPDEALNEVRLKLHLKGWFTSNSSLVLGDRELLRHEVVKELASAADAHTGPKFLHIVVRLADIKSVYASTTTGRQLSFDQGAGDGARPQRSALTAALANEGSSVQGETNADDSALLVRGLVLHSGEELDGALTRTRPEAGGSSEAVVHLVIRRTAKIDWAARGANFELSIQASDSADVVKRRAEALTGLPHGSHLLLHCGEVLSGRSLSDYGVHKGSVLELVPYEPCIPQSLPDGSPPLSSPDHELFDGFQAARAGLANGHAPKLAAGGTGGSYFIAGADGRPVAVFKPLDEEPLAANNPKKHKGGSAASGEDGLRRGIRPGEGATREVAAFLLDHEHFAGVPPTALVSCRDSGPAPCEGAKIGSLQVFVAAEGDCEERGVSQFPVREVHKIALLDMRLGNCDRNGGNILVKKGDEGGLQLVPIDHGYILPDSFQDLSFEWMFWPQAAAPLDAACLEYVQRTDADRDLAMLAQHGLAIRPECARVLRVLTALLKKAAARRMTPADIASVMCREGPGMSPLEKLHSRAIRRTVAFGNEPAIAAPALSAAAEPVYLQRMDELLDEYLDETLLDGPVGA